VERPSAGQAIDPCLMRHRGLALLLSLTLLPVVHLASTKRTEALLDWFEHPIYLRRFQSLSSWTGQARHNRNKGRWCSAFPSLKMPA